MHTPRNLTTIPSAAESVGCCVRSVYNWLAAGHLKRYRAGHRTLVDIDELVEFLAPKPAD